MGLSRVERDIVISDLAAARRATGRTRQEPKINLALSFIVNCSRRQISIGSSLLDIFGSLRISVLFHLLV
jgi:hypothetical protein